LDFANFNRPEFLEAMGKYRDRKRRNLVKFLNDSKVLPYKVEIPEPLSLAQTSTGSQKWSVYSAATMTLLDFSDKWTTYVIDEHVDIPRGKPGKVGKVLNWLADREEWWEKRPTLAKVSNLGTAYLLKGVAFTVSTYNMYATVTTARFDYQHEVSKLDWVSNVSASTLAVQDVLVEVGAIVEKKLGKAAMARICVSITTNKGASYGIGATTGLSGAGAVFATINVLAMIVSGFTTMITMGTSAAKSYRNGDYASAGFYGFGAIGGVMMIAGGVALGLSIMQVGGVFTATGAGATIGVVLFLVGGIIAGISALFGWWASSDDYQIYARKCFLGDQFDKEPRWGVDPPDWSTATTNDGNSWPLENQRMGLMNLMGRFQVKTTPTGSPERNSGYSGDVKFKITPGLFPPGSRVEVALHKDGGAQTSATFEWVPYNPNSGANAKTEIPVETKKNGSFDPSKMLAFFTVNKGSVSAVSTVAPSVSHFTGDTLLATVTIRMGGEKNVIRCKKLVMKPGAVYGMHIPDDDETADIFK
jgi:hypothetical protein